MSPALIWFIVGIALILAEFIMPGLIVAFFGLGALVAALTTVIGLTTSFTWQMVVFIVVAVASLFLLRRFLKKTFLGKTEGRDVEEFNVDIGKIVPVTEEINALHGTGRVKYQGTPWKATCEDIIPEGDNVRITGKDNITLLVEKVD
ncbi:MAG: NfeD family protein [Candidatus Cloacimonetes bacterium]|nr:NfeD family protein [Candidatus Cloacimonadota bacterium]